LGLLTEGCGKLVWANFPLKGDGEKGEGARKNFPKFRRPNLGQDFTLTKGRSFKEGINWGLFQKGRI